MVVLPAWVILPILVDFYHHEDDKRQTKILLFLLLDEHDFLTNRKDYRFFVPSWWIRFGRTRFVLQKMGGAKVSLAIRAIYNMSAHLSYVTKKKRQINRSTYQNLYFWAIALTKDRWKASQALISVGVNRLHRKRNLFDKHNSL